MHHFSSSFSCFSHTGGKLFRSTVVVRSDSQRISLCTIFGERRVRQTAFATVSSICKIYRHPIIPLFKKFEIYITYVE